MIEFTKQNPPIWWRDALQEPELRTRENKPAPSRWHRLTVVGVKSVKGRLVKLDFARLPHGPHTHRGAILNFIRELNDVAALPTTNDSDTATAMRELAAAGLAGA